MSNWKVIISEHTINYVLNPSVEIAGNYAALPGTAIARVEAGGAYGHAMLYVQCNANNEGVSFTLSDLPAGGPDTYVTVVVIDDSETLAGNWDWSLDNVSYYEPALIMTMGGAADDRWQLYGYPFLAADVAVPSVLYIRQNGGTAIDFYIDGVQAEIENADHWTTFCDGDQPGCRWDGVPHASTSRRSTSARRGGRVRDLEDDYNFSISGMRNVGSAFHDLSIDEYALLPGGEINNDRLDVRQFVLMGSIDGTSWSDYHDNRSDLIGILTSQAFPNDARGPQPVRLWYTGTERVKYCDAFFNGGLDLALDASRDGCYFERNIAIQFTAPDPIWYEVVDDSFLLDTADPLAVRYAAGRVFGIPPAATRVGVWGNMSIGADSGTVYAIAVGPDGLIYVGGAFAQMDGVGGTVNIAAYDPFTNVWQPLAGGRDNTVRALRFGPDGLLYAGGLFNNAGTERIASWNGAAWAAVGGGPGAGLPTCTAVYAIEFGLDGLLYAGGDFTDWQAGGADWQYIVSWNGVAWAVLDADELNDVVWAIKVAPNGDLYIAGEFVSKAGPISLEKVCYWEGTDFLPLGTTANNGLSGNAYALAIDRSGQVYIAGAFTTARGDTVNRICRWNGTGFEALGNGLGATAYALAIGPDETVIVGGGFTTMTDLGWVDALARWADSSWAAVDIDFPANTTVYAIATGDPDAVIRANYDLWVGFDQFGTASVAGNVGFFSDRLGTFRTYPTIVFECTGGGTGRVVSCKNTTTGDELNLNYFLQAGERLTIYLEPTRKRITSSFYGERPSAVLPNSDFGSFSILSRTPGTDYPVWASITSFVAITGAPTIDAWIQFANAYEGVDSD